MKARSRNQIYAHVSALLAMTVVLAGLLALPDARADDKDPPTISKRSKSLNFDGAVIEGMKKDPLDSLEQIGRNDGDKNNHLYRKRANFRKEMKVNAQEMGYSP